MHNSALKTAKLFFETYYQNKEVCPFICEVGSKIYRAETCPYTIRDIAPKNSIYIGLDFCEGEGVDVVLQNPYKFPLDDNSFDFVVASSCFEHSEMFWVTFLECIRILKPHGILYLNTPCSNMEYHKFPVDCWRFFPDSGKALETWGRYNNISLKLLESYTIKPSFEKIDDYPVDCVSIFIKDEKYENLYPNKIMELDNFDKNYEFIRTNLLR